MSIMSKAVASAVLIACLAALAPEGAAQPLTIYEIQFTENEDGSSDYDTDVVDCAGGICTAKWAGFGLPRLMLQDPDYPDGWSGIQVKDWTPERDLYDNVVVGDWVALTDVQVYEKVGTTLLYYFEQDPTSGYTIVSQGNSLPAHLPVAVSDIPAPIEGPPGEWYVDNHDAELYESMRLVVRDVTVTEMDLGKAADNYNLQDAEGANCWAADYMNEDVGDNGYHPFVQVGQYSCAVSGVFEQYTNLSNGWDYYQLVTLSSADLFLCGDLNHDGCVDHADLGILLTDWGCTGGNCPGDCDGDGDTDHGDLGILLTHWGEGCP